MISSSILDDGDVRFEVDEVALDLVSLLSFFSFSPANHHSTIAAIVTYPYPLRYAVALTGQLIIASFVC
jgi:hypothetical protein